MMSFERNTACSSNKFIHAYVRGKIPFFSIKKKLKYINKVNEMVVMWPFRKLLMIYR